MMSTVDEKIKEWEDRQGQYVVQREYDMIKWFLHDLKEIKEQLQPSPDELRKAFEAGREMNYPDNVAPSFSNYVYRSYTYPTFEKFLMGKSQAPVQSPNQKP